MGDVEPLLMSTIGKIKASKKIVKSLQCRTRFVLTNFPPCFIETKIPYSMEQCRSTCYFDDSMGIGMRTGFGTRMTVPRIIEDDAVVIQEDQSEENICNTQWSLLCAPLVFLIGLVALIAFVSTMDRVVRSFQ